MQPRSPDPAPRPPRTEDEPASYARRAAERAQQVYDEASASVERVTERRVRYQEVVIRREIRQAALENERTAALDREQARVDASSESEFLRDQIAPMLEDGWTLEQLEEIGITREMPVSLDLFHEVARRSRTADDTP